MAENSRRGPGRVSRVVGTFMHPVVDAMDVDSVVGRIDVDSVVERIDVNEALDRLDVNRVLDRIDVDRILARVDINALVERIDIDGVVQRVDINAVAQRLDLNELLSRVDVDQLLKRTDIGSVVTDSAETIATSAIDMIRRQLAGLDAVTTNVARRAIRRHDVTTQAAAEDITDRPAGPVSRLSAFLIDTVVVSVMLSVGVAVGGYLLSLFLRHDADPVSHGGRWWVFIVIGFGLLYQWVSLVLAGRTVGKGLLGMRVVLQDGRQVTPGAALVRVLVYPFSFILGLGFIGVVFGRQRRAMHDAAAHTLVVYAWGSRQAELPRRIAAWLGRAH